MRGLERSYSVLHGVTAMRALPAEGPKTVDGTGPLELPRDQFSSESPNPPAVPGGGA